MEGHEREQRLFIDVVVERTEELRDKIIHGILPAAVYSAMSARADSAVSGNLAFNVPTGRSTLHGVPRRADLAGLTTISAEAVFSFPNK